MSTSSRFITSIYTLLSFLLLGIVLIVSTTSHPFKVGDYQVKLDILFLVFQFVALHLPMAVFISLLLFFSIVQEILSGSELGFYVFTYGLSIIGPSYFIRNYVYRINVPVFVAFLLITVFLKTSISILLLLNIYDLNYLNQYWSSVGVQEFFFNFVTGVVIYFSFFFINQIVKVLYTFRAKIRQL